MAVAQQYSIELQCGKDTKMEDRYCGDEFQQCEVILREFRRGNVGMGKPRYRATALLLVFPHAATKSWKNMWARAVAHEKAQIRLMRSIRDISG